uniref:Uncharacterized protein n=2 Tax=Oryza glaberrima TaxID=4538 RepID=I1Q2A3_ORYGL
MNSGGVRVEGRRGRGLPCRYDAGGGDGDVGRRTGTAEEAAGVGADETEGEAARATAFRRNSDDAVAWPGKRMPPWCRGRRRRRQPKHRRGGTGGWGSTVAATPLDDGGNALPMVTARNGGQAGGEDVAAMPRMATARPTDARARRERRLETAGGGRRHGRERTTAGRGGAATGRRGRRLKRENGRRGFHFIGAGREPATGEGGTEAGMAAGGHGRWPGMARLFRVINGAIQGGN